MRDPKRIPKILKELEKLWKQHPDYRLGQLIGNYLEGPNLYYIEDEDLIKILNRCYNPEPEDKEETEVE